MPTERELNAAIARRHLEDLRAILGRDNEDIERLADLWPPVPRVTILLYRKDSKGGATPVADLMN